MSLRLYLDDFRLWLGSWLMRGEIDDYQDRINAYIGDISQLQNMLERERAQPYHGSRFIALKQAKEDMERSYDKQLYEAQHLVIQLRSNIQELWKSPSHIIVDGNMADTAGYTLQNLLDMDDEEYKNWIKG